ncbi:MAG: sugar phosphate isomerase/epimerase family protein [Candidatus Sigynarchaeota archaeon]
MIMKAGVSSMFFGDMRSIELFSLLGRYPTTRVIDLWYDTPFHLLADEAGRLGVISSTKQQLDKSGMEIVTHAAAFDVNPIAYSPAMQRHTLAETRASLVFASAMGAKLATLHGGFSSFGSRVSRFDIILLERFIAELLDFIEKEKLDITICLENDAASESMSRPLESLYIIENMLEKNPQIGITLDLAHVIKTTNIEATCHVREPRLSRSTMKDFLNVHGGRIRVLHLSSPNKHRTHGRMNLASNELLLGTIHEIACYVNMDAVPCIFEYDLEEFAGPSEAMDAITADAALISKIMDGE